MSVRPASARAAAPAAFVPASPEEITADWLTGALDGAFPGARVTTIRQTGFIDGTAQKLRFQLAYAPGGRQGPASLWIKGGFDPKGAEQGDAFANEVRFFLDLAPLVDINIPRCFFGAIDAASNNGVVILEDLILRGATFGRATAPLSADQAAAVLSLQARFHARFWRGRDVAQFPWLVPGGAIARAGIVDQYFGLWDDAAARPRLTCLTAEQRDRPRVQRALNLLMRDMRENPVCAVHGDSQGGNLFFDADGRPGYLDWQHCMLGNWAFDVAGFMATSLTVADRRAHERDLIAHYLRELAANGAVPPPFDTAWNDYARYVMWAFMWVMCPVEAHPEEICSANSERACAAIADLGTLDRLGV